MGVPVSPRNIFPSNIQGLPTWYEVRVTEKGYLGRRGGVDLMVAMNPQTWAEDVKPRSSPAATSSTTSTKPMPSSMFRDDINVVGVPLTAITNATYTDAAPAPAVQEHHLRRRARRRCSTSTPSEIERLFGEQFKGKEKLLDSNVKALQLGLDWARSIFEPDAVKLKVQRADNVGDRIFVDGNNAAALGAVYGGATVCAWYPITPSSSLAEAFQRTARSCASTRRPARPSYAIVQAEDELASIGIVIGAGWNGARAFTATVGPGHLADDRVHRPRLLRRDPGGDLRRAARRPVDRHADAHAAGRPAELRLRLARRHQARAAVPRGSARSASTSPPRRSTSPTGCRRRCSS